MMMLKCVNPENCVTETLAQPLHINCYETSSNLQEKTTLNSSGRDELEKLMVTENRTESKHLNGVARL